MSKYQGFEDEDVCFFEIDVIADEFKENLDGCLRIIDELILKIKKKLIDRDVLPKSKLYEALGYFCSLIPYLKNYTVHACAEWIIMLQKERFDLLPSVEKIGLFLEVRMEERQEQFYYHSFKPVAG